MGTPTPDVMAVFDRAAEIADPADREDYLAAACAGVRADARAGDFLDPPGAAPAASSPRAPPDTAAPGPAAEVGTVVAGKYKLLQEVGEGGMWSVYMADQLHPVKRRVAVKVIKAGMDSARVLARFEAERQALALMDHPHIARVLDAGATDAGRPFFVMDLVKGVPLAEFCDQHKLPVLDRLNLFMQVCSAVQHAHQKGIIHRDLKPTNILVESHDGKPVPKVIDFGLAKATSGMQLTERTLFTALGTVAGTPLYMAPEQAAFNAIDVDTRADVYALGVILYELLTGTTPIEREMFQKAGFDELMRLIREQEPATPSSRLGSSESKVAVAAVRQTEPARLGRFVRGELDWIVMKALEKERDRRYESATAFARDIERFLNHEPVAAGPPTVRYRVRKFVSRNRGLLTATGLVAVALVVGTGVSVWQAVRATRARTAADGQRVRAQANFSRALDAVDLMLTRVGEKRLAAVPQMEEERRRLLEDALRFYLEFLRDEGDDPRVRPEVARAYQRTAHLSALLGDSAGAEDAYGRALAIQGDLADRFPDDPAHRYRQAVSHRGLAGVLAATGQAGRAEAAYRDAAGLLEPLAATHPDAPDFHRELGATYDGLGQLHLAVGDLKSAAADFGRALEVREWLAGDHREAEFQGDVARTRGHIGLLHRDEGDKEAAHGSLAAALAIWERLAAEDPNEPEYQSELAGVNGYRGALYREAGDVPRAERVLATARDLRQRLADDHPKVPAFRAGLARAHVALAELFRFSGRPADARAALKVALGLLEPLRRAYARDVEIGVASG
jgi:serine/threonine protein kinase/tetratricopeptide (TPR) repeat protein